MLANIMLSNIQLALKCLKSLNCSSYHKRDSSMIFPVKRSTGDERLILAVDAPGGRRPLNCRNGKKLEILFSQEVENPA